jgi:membrane protease YdiL (CAAX protease family)
VTALQAIPGRTQPTRVPGSTFLYSFIVYLIVLQTVYAYAYVHSLQLRTNTLMQIVLRLGTWTLPVVIYLIHSRQDIFEYLKLRRHMVRGVIWGLFVGSILIALNLIGTQLLKGHVRVNLLIGQGLWWKGVILVGFSEEVVFRGYLLQEFAKRTSFWMANLAQAMLFLIVHCAGWMILGQFSTPGVFHTGGYVFLFGLLLGVVWKKSGSLWSCILLHSISNLCSFAIL